MVARGHGVIVNITAMAAEFGMEGAGAYGASKAAVASLWPDLGCRVRPHRFRVNAVSPGPTRTPGVQPLAALIDATLGSIPLRGSANQGEIAQTVAFLASPEASYITGAVLPADGGRVAV
jgi:NAD(P)-dependent dehydrogenase (short-subunit alcohol dehydrogenase family)